VNATGIEAASCGFLPKKTIPVFCYEGSIDIAYFCSENKDFKDLKYIKHLNEFTKPEKLNSINC